MTESTIGKISAILKTGKTPPSQNESYFQKDFNWYTPGDIGEKKYLNKSERHISKLAVSARKASLYPKNSILVTCIGNIGRVGISKIECASNQQITAITPIESVNVEYLYYWFVANQVFLSKKANNAVVPILNNKSLKEINFNYPPLETQQKIAQILDDAAALRDKTAQLRSEYDALAQSIFLDMFGDPVTNPKGWEKVAMKDLMIIQRGGSPRPIKNFLGGIYPWIKIGDATKGDDIYLHFTKEKIIEEGLSKTRLLPKGSLIFANCGVSLGFARIIQFEGCIHDGWLAFSEFDEMKINKIFILKALNSITQFFRDTAPDGTQPNLNTSIMKSFKLIIPPIDLQNSFEQKLKLINEQKNLAKQELKESEDLFNCLLQKAFKGELVKE
jgi:type I restriction enzyme S subunit